MNIMCMTDAQLRACLVHIDEHIEAALERVAELRTDASTILREIQRRGDVKQDSSNEVAF